MELDVMRFKKIILKGIFKDNQRKCAIALDLNKILKNKSSAGAKFFGKLKKFCDTNKMNFDDFIFLK